jgi:hypothetical protein
LADLVNPGGGDGGDGGGPGGYDKDSEESYGPDPGSYRSRRPPGGPPGPPDGNDPNNFSFNSNPNRNPKPFKPQPVHFDTKLKPDVIPEWDGNTDELMRWIRKINDISNYSDYTRIQLGQQVPLKFTKRAARWYGSLSVSYQREITENWDTLKLAILIHFMSRAVLEKAKAVALAMHYRDKGHEDETPEDYVIRKEEALTGTCNWTDSELVFEIMNSAPKSWRTLIDTYTTTTYHDLLDQVSWFQADLMAVDCTSNPNVQRQLDKMMTSIHKLENKNHSSSKVRSHKVDSKPIGWHKYLSKPKFKRQDNNTSKKKTPKDVGARGCKYGGSLNHWDRECTKPKTSDIKQAQAHATSLEDEEAAAQNAYDDLCDEILDSATETEDLMDFSNESESEQDFHKAPKSHTATTSSTKPLAGSQESQGSLGGTSVNQEDSLLIDLGRQTLTNEVLSEMVNSNFYKNTLGHLPSRKAFTKKLKNATRTLASMIGEEITLKRLMSRPPGTAFYGSKATIIKGCIQSKLGVKHRITFDTGSEITLINEDLILELSPVPKIKSGQKLKLVQVTGNSTISQYVIVPLIFDTDLGPIKMTVEAYIVPKMNAPFILGTDFASQFQLSLIRDNLGTRIQFGDTGRSIKVEESETSPQINNSGAFKVEISTFYSSNKDRRKKSKKLQDKRRKDKTLPLDSTKVKSLETIVIPPETMKRIKVKTQFNPDQEEGFVQRDFGFYRNQDDVYAVADCLITTVKPELQVANFSK